MNNVMDCCPIPDAIQYCIFYTANISIVYSTRPISVLYILITRPISVFVRFLMDIHFLINSEM